MNTGIIRFVGGGTVAVAMWIYKRQSMPRFVHVLAIIGFVAGVLMGVTDDGGWRQRLWESAQFSVIMVALVYVSFGFYGGKAMDARHPPPPGRRGRI